VGWDGGTVTGTVAKRGTAVSVRGTGAWRCAALARLLAGVLLGLWVGTPAWADPAGAEKH
jgi:hypothetical protein